MGLDPTLIPLNFETDVDHHLETTNNLDLLIYLLFMCFGRVVSSPSTLVFISLDNMLILVS